MRRALFYRKSDDGTISCTLCCHYCRIQSGSAGICAVRRNMDGELYSLVYGKVIARHVDPVEKKPLFHFMPGTTTYSIATVGCNFRCLHCQNFEISEHARNSNNIPGYDMSPEDVVSAAINAGCSSISYTYTEPTIFMEFALDCARLAHSRGLKNIFVSNGYTSPEATDAVAPFLDANNIDLKGDDIFYRKIAGARLQPVLDTIKRMNDRGVWVEVTTLIIPGLNDSDEFLRWAAEFIASVDTAIPWHLTGFHPTHKMTDRPATPLESLTRARKIGFDAGLRYVYQGNIRGVGENTICYLCGELLIERLGFTIQKMVIKDSSCPACGANINGVGLP